MSSKNVNPTEKSLFVDNANQNSAPCPAPIRPALSHHVRHHSYDTTSNKLAAQIFPSSRSNRKDNSNVTDNHHHQHHGRFLPARSSHRHTASYASDQSSFQTFNSNHHPHSASQENLRRKSTSPRCLDHTDGERERERGPESLSRADRKCNSCMPDIITMQGIK